MARRNGTTTSTKKRLQQGFDERHVDDPELEAALSQAFENKEAAKDTPPP